MEVVAIRGASVSALVVLDCEVVMRGSISVWVVTSVATADDWVEVVSVVALEVIADVAVTERPVKVVSVVAMDSELLRESVKSELTVEGVAEVVVETEDRVSSAVVDAVIVEAVPGSTSKVESHKYEEFKRMSEPCLIVT
jgi:hypothetical protein